MHTGVATSRCHSGPAVSGPQDLRSDRNFGKCGRTGPNGLAPALPRPRIRGVKGEWSGLTGRKSSRLQQNIACAVVVQVLAGREYKHRAQTLMR